MAVPEPAWQAARRQFHGLPAGRRGDAGRNPRDCTRESRLSRRPAHRHRHRRRRGRCAAGAACRSSPWPPRTRPSSRTPSSRPCGIRPPYRRILPTYMKRQRASSARPTTSRAIEALVRAIVRNAASRHRHEQRCAITTLPLRPDRRHRAHGPGRDRLLRRLCRRRHAQRDRRRRTASRISSSIWRSRAPNAAARGASPRRSRRSAATSTPTPRASRPPITSRC